MKATQQITVIAVVGLALLGGLIAVGHHHASVHRQILVSALTSQLDGHAERIQVLLNTMGTNDTAAIEEAAYNELQGIPSTSLISRSDVKVIATNSGLQCRIDTSRFGVAPRIVRQSTSQGAAP